MNELSLYYETIETETQKAYTKSSEGETLCYLGI